MASKRDTRHSPGTEGERQDGLDVLEQLAVDFDRIHGLVAGRLFSYIAREMRNGDISYSQQNALYSLFVAKSLTVGQLATELGLSQTATSHLVDRLLNRELVTRVEHPDDRRRKIIALTPAGRERILDMKRYTIESYMAVLSPLPNTVVTSLAEGLRKLASHLSVPTLPDVEVRPPRDCGGTLSRDDGASLSEENRRAASQSTSR